MVFFNRFTIKVWICVCTFHGIIALYEDAFLRSTQLIEKYGYPYEAHDVTTEDGYILTHFRIPFGKNNDSKNIHKIPVILQHGYMESSSLWIVKETKSLGFQLANEGYDVWLMNTRGSENALKHKTLNPSTDSEFWNYSLHEIGIYDLPNTIDYILNLTNNKMLFHIGHSQGAASVYILLSEKPKYNRKFITHISYAPVAFLNHSTSPLLNLFGRFEKNYHGLTNLRNYLGDFNIFPTENGIRLALSLSCVDNAPMQIYCLQLFQAFVGLSEVNTTMLPIMYGHSFISSSLKQSMHFVQLHLSGLFRQFDYGTQLNLRKYGNPNPPEYNVQNVLIPIYIFYGDNDALVTPIDAKRISKLLPNLQQSIKLDEWSHTDFFFKDDVDTKLYPQTLAILKKYQ